MRTIWPAGEPDSFRCWRRAALARTLLVAGVLAVQLAGASSPALSQGLQFLGVTPPSEKQAGPFSGGAGNVLQPSLGDAGREPHAVLPTAPEGKATLGVYAGYGAGNKAIARGLVWRVFSAQPDPETGAYPLVAEQDEAAPVFFLTPGSYIVHVSYGMVSLAKEVRLGQSSQREAFTLQAGGLRLQADVEKTAISPQFLTFDIFEGSFLYGRASSQPYYKGATAGEVVLLPEGTYHVVSTYGDANAVVRADVNVAPGKLTDATMHHRAAEVALKLVKQKGGAAVSDTQWTVITPGGDTIKESIGPEPTFVLSEGAYTVIARNNGINFSQEFKVEPGANQKLEVLMR